MSKSLPRGLALDKAGYRIQFVSRSQPGRRYRERLAAGTTRRQAESYLAKLREDDRMGELVWPNEREAVSPRESFTVREYARDIYLPYCEARNAPATIKSKKQNLIYTDDWFGDVPLDEIDVALVYQYQNERKTQGVRARTVNLGWSTIRSLLNHAHRTGVIRNPAPQAAKLPETDRREQRALDPDEAQRALEYAAGRQHMWYALALCLLHTGARWGDVRGLRWVDIDLDGAMIRYRAETSKQGRDREVPLVPELVAALRQIPRLDDLVFARTSYHTHEVITLAPGAKVADKYPWEGPDGDCCFGPHRFRHTFASWKLSAGVPIAVVSRWLGHASIQLTVDRYGHIEPRDHKDEIMRGPRPQVRRLRVVGED